MTKARTWVVVPWLKILKELQSFWNKNCLRSQLQIRKGWKYLLLKAFQWLRSSDDQNWGWVSMILLGTVPAPEALFGAEPACAARSGESKEMIPAHGWLYSALTFIWPYFQHSGGKKMTHPNPAIQFPAKSVGPIAFWYSVCNTRWKSLGRHKQRDPTVWRKDGFSQHLQMETWTFFFSFSKIFFPCSSWLYYKINAALICKCKDTLRNLG